MRVTRLFGRENLIKKTVTLTSSSSSSDNLAFVSLSSLSDLSPFGSGGRPTFSALQGS